MPQEANRVSVVDGVSTVPREASLRNQGPCLAVCLLPYVTTSVRRIRFSGRSDARIPSPVLRDMEPIIPTLPSPYRTTAIGNDKTAKGVAHRIGIAGR
jgi:hypothetical protein